MRDVPYQIQSIKDNVINREITDPDLAYSVISILYNCRTYTKTLILNDLIKRDIQNCIKLNELSNLLKILPKNFNGYSKWVNNKSTIVKFNCTEQLKENYDEVIMFLYKMKTEEKTITWSF